MTETNSSIPVNEVFWTLVEKADKKFSKIRDLPYYERTRYEYFFKVFKVYTQLWKFQQENRQKLVESGLKRWEIGEIASRIAQLYYGQYMRTSDASYLSESYVFYEAIFTREYFKDGLFQDLNLANKQLRFLARFLMVCLVLNRRDMVHQLVNQLKVLVDECRRTYQETDFKEWKLVIQEIIRFLKADTAFMNIRPLRYSLVLDPNPDSLPCAKSKRQLRLRDVVLSSYHHNEVKFSELTLDTFRMLQCLEWEPSGTFYKPNDSKLGQNGIPGPSRVNYAQDIVDPTLPPNPRKVVLHRPSMTHFLAVLGTLCEELNPDGVLLVYLSASGRTGNTVSSVPESRGSISSAWSSGRNLQSHSLDSDAPSASNSLNNSADPPARKSKKDCLNFGTHSNGGQNSVYPSDLIPFTRRPLFIVIDSDGSDAFKASGCVINGAEKGEPAAILLSPISSILNPATDVSRRESGSLFTIFLTAPVQAFCLLLGLSSPDTEMVKLAWISSFVQVCKVCAEQDGLLFQEIYTRAEKLLASSLNDWGASLVMSEPLDPVWAQVLGDPFLRRLVLRFLFCRAALTLHGTSFGKKEFHPDCFPSLPPMFLPTATAPQTLVLQLANIFGASKKFFFSDGIMLPPDFELDLE
ncbi:Protein SCAI [Linum perenne]